MVAVATRSTPVAAVKKKKRNVEKEIRLSCKQRGKGIQEQKKNVVLVFFFFFSFLRIQSF